MKQRIDDLIIEREILDDIKKTRSFIMQGKVYVDGEKIEKAGHRVDYNSHIEIKGFEDRYVSRGGYKLEKAIKDFNLVLDDKVVMDIGSSTGGFTDCMLQNGAKKVFAIDVGYGQLDWKLRKDDRVVVMERTNIRDVEEDDIGRKMDFITTDVSFISLELVLPIIRNLLDENGKAVILIKPQFEAKREDVGEKGVIRDFDVHRYVLENMIDVINELNFYVQDLTYSPITGATGNIEFLALISTFENNNKIDLDELVKEAHTNLL